MAVVAAAAITLRHHAAEALLEVGPQGDMPGVAMPELECGRLELDGAVLTGPVRGTVAGIGTVATGMAVIGAVAITGVAEIGTAIIGIIAAMM